MNRLGPFHNTLDLSRIAMFGHSIGGATVAEAMGEDSRIAAGVNLDGPLGGAVLDTGLDGPFLLFGSAQRYDSGGATDPSWQRFWTRLRGWRQGIVLTDGGHLSFTDIILFAGLGEPFDASSYMPPRAFAAGLGSILPPRAVSINRAFLLAFFDRFLRGGEGGLLEGPSPLYPEVRFEHP